jgi:PII-like signaling protein
MNIEGTAGNLRIFMGESDEINGMPLYEVIIRAAREAGLAGATVFKGIISFGASHSIQSMTAFNFSHDTPVLVEIVEDHMKLESFFPILFKMMDESKKGGLVTLENVKVLRYRKGLKYTNYAI